MSAYVTGQVINVYNECSHNFMYGLTTELPIIYSLFCILIGVIYAYLLYRNNKFENKILSRILFIFRSFIVSVLAFFLLNPFISKISTVEEKPIVVLAQDVSISCAGSKDSTFFASLSDQLSNNFDVVEYNYSDDVSEGFSSKKIGESTDISNLLEEVELKYSGRNLLALVSLVPMVYIIKDLILCTINFLNQFLYIVLLLEILLFLKMLVFLIFYIMRFHF